MKQIEVPYNFDKNLITALKIIYPNGEPFQCFYTAPYWEDYRSAKYYYVEKFGGRDMNTNRGMTRDDYIDHMEYINQCFPNKLMLLLQQTDTFIDDDLLTDFYINKLKFSKFCVGNLEQAKKLKAINPNFEIIASIAMKLEPDKLSPEELQEYSTYLDGVVLWFPFNRDIYRVKSLPRCFNHTLLVNCSCSIYCDGTHHWFASKEEEEHLVCPKMNGYSFNDIIYIKPIDLPLWDDFISNYKLQGREQTTQVLLPQIMAYTTNWRHDDFTPLYRSYDYQLYTPKNNEIECNNRPIFYALSEQEEANYLKLEDENGLCSGFLFVEG